MNDIDALREKVKKIEESIARLEDLFSRERVTTEMDDQMFALENKRESLIEKIRSLSGDKETGQ